MNNETTTGVADKTAAPIDAKALKINIKPKPEETVTPTPSDNAGETGKLESCNAQRNPLEDHSLIGEGNKLAEQAQQQVPLLGDLCLKGQTSIWYAAPNTGKTLLALSLTMKAISDRRIEGNKVFYINADDSASGMAQKTRLLDDLGVHTLTPGFKKFTAKKLTEAMRLMANNGTAKGTLIIIDTVKKFFDLMSKKESKEFGDLTRQISLKGGTVLGLAHTNKNLNAKGKPVHAGTSDLMEDFDTIYMLECLNGAKKHEKFIKATNEKRRGDNVEETHFKFSSEFGLSYEQRLLSVIESDPEFGDIEVQIDMQEQDIIDNIRAAIKHKNDKKMKIVATVNKATKASRNTILDVLVKHSGPNPEEHLWDFDVRGRGAHVYSLHEKPEAEPAEG
ncbi:hypothetical protein LPB140_03210 [Sphingorhabdus lutea]|uniref:Uncharacterized protein n=1 Tax=Sphingorhabdus lutea TaxID=1913578 RepID=A0A1L3JA38_9SPHN|nr:AAA family ATPase [Sphingorhabdus lutea]APG61991.1 hypothetical protein LPB140_03210 [Sphingorhabdus lutea]